MMIKRLTFGDAAEANAVAKELMAAGERHPVLKEMGLYTFWGGHTWVAYERGKPVALTCGRIGKRKKNIWEPYLNWYAAYTLEDYRRQGYATKLYRMMEEAAVAAGCRRIKSLAGSGAGLALHSSLDHLCWGQNANHEVHVDSPLYGCAMYYKNAGPPPQMPMDRPLTRIEINNLVAQGLRYDRNPSKA